MYVYDYNKNIYLQRYKINIKNKTRQREGFSLKTPLLGNFKSTLLGNFK